ncbi:serine carboxypeptidase S28 [Oesophagostomum dentatum]|uniref:Serine carboxypeptidase S28 n=1 Tax=Oesophagostomum dentatum TaxID=61180 RepID=A0A0B1TEL4_OESDE|nr:serine carboxypeptidase S28 [Oesophagostomum dentatum]
MIVLFTLLALGEAFMHIRDQSTWTPIRSREGLPQQPKYSYNWTEEYLKDVPVDHFSFSNKDSFKLRYFINADSYKPGGPIFFYTGNEGKLEGFAENTGFMWDIAPEFKAAVVFAEHRFYGKTQPYGDKSYNTTEYLGYLSSEQALADFVLLIDYLRQERLEGAANSAVIAFGGSYGGMLAAWIRTKYPHKVDGAIAASAPVFWFMDSNVPEDIYDKIVTRSFLNSGCNRKAVEKGWRALQNLAQSADGRAYLNDLFHLEEKSRLSSADDHKFLAAFIREVFESMAMVNYPYPTEFLAPLPGWPVKEACKFLSTVPKSDEEAAKQLYEVANLYYNHSGTTESFCANAERCQGAFAALGDPMGWPWQYSVIILYFRYFINTDSYEAGGPIFFYTGNEGKLEGFAENTGFMWDIAPEFKAAVVFAEHRFYGKTQPYGDKSYNTTEYLGYLSSEQALADFVLLIDYLRQERLEGAASSAVIAFGGSYGGMLAAWIRTKYPHKSRMEFA